MKLTDLAQKPLTGRIIQQFGQALLVRYPNGSHELLGGSRSDLLAAKEWASLFAHDIVFSHATRQPIPPCRSRRKLFSSRLRFL